MINKEKILNEAREKLALVVAAAKEETVAVRASIIKLRQRLKNFSSIDNKVEAIILANNLERERQLGQLAGSPYFVRCDVRFPDEEKELYFGKFQMSESNVYSWVSPIAQVRFAQVGQTEYRLPNGNFRSGELLRKNQFMIVDDRIMFMSSEAVDYSRILIHQEQLVSKKSEFVLPEIIAKMEKAQDEVIRAEHRGSFLIAGPAGSGKTTLAFHRIAYLAQSPDTAKIYPGWNIIVFVQDESTKKYFSAILPQLGIEEVKVTTFEQWALEVLNLTDYKLVIRYGKTEAERDLYEYYKNLALKGFSKGKKLPRNFQNILSESYGEYLPEKFKLLFKEQLKEKRLDRFDLTILLQNLADESGQIKVERRLVVEDKKGNLKMASKLVPLSFAFVVVDEAENYLAEQISIIKSSVNENNSILYVGDLAQQTKYSTIKKWEDAQENFTSGRKVLLDKVYRNTKEILRYVEAQGYEVDILPDLKSGSPVVEKNISTSAEINDYVQEIIKNNRDASIGVLYRSGDESLVKNLKPDINDNYKILSFNEAQGVEFEVVVVIKRHDKIDAYNGYSEELKKEKEKIDRDLWYVALTRSMNQLHVLKIVDN